ncbi:MAG: hypothetical protein V5A55_09105 [Halovenus sp.]
MILDTSFLIDLFDDREGAFEKGIELSDFQDRTEVYDRAATHGPVSRGMARNLRALYANNRTDYYYDNAVPTGEMAGAVVRLATELHRFVVTHSTTHRFEQYRSCEHR